MPTRRALSALAIATLPLRRAAANTDANLNALLTRYIILPPDGVTRVRYAALKASTEDMRALDAWIARAATRRPSEMARAEAFAFWVNLYNALTLKVVLERYPLHSIRDIRSTGVLLDPKAWLGPWRTRLITVEGKRMSLDDIEHGTMRATFRDPRVHYAVNCASIGCPNLWPRAWQATTLEAELNAAASAYVNHPRGVTVLSDGRLRVSSIYYWFREDFGGNDGGIIAHLKRYASLPLSQRLSENSSISWDTYDWALNNAPAGS